MKVKFTRRSKKDGDLVTMSMAQFKNSPMGEDLYYGWEVGQEITVVVNGIPTLFTFARPDKHGWPTAVTTRCFPRSLRLPRVGRPVYADVTEIH